MTESSSKPPNMADVVGEVPALAPAALVVRVLAVAPAVEVELDQASALNSVPSWNLTPSRSLKVYERPPSSGSGISVASAGITSVLSGAKSSRPSKIWRVTLEDSASVVLTGGPAMTESAPGRR